MGRMAEYAMEQQEQQNLSGAFDENDYNDWLNDPVAQAEYKKYLDNKKPRTGQQVQLVVSQTDTCNPF